MAHFSKGRARRELDKDDDTNAPFYIRYKRLLEQPRSTAASNPGDRTTTSTAALQQEKPIAVKEEQTSEELAQQNHGSGAKVQRTEASVESAPLIGNGNGESKSPSGPVSMTLADPDLLDCPICFQPLSSPVYQCENGHTSCGSCCTTILKNKCSNCCLPIGTIRCRTMEKVLESVRVTCQYVPYGCTEMFSYSKKVAHEKACNYAPLSCPCIGCNFVGISKCLYDHFALKHKDTSKQFCFHILTPISMDSTQDHVILREETEGVFFVLYRCIETLGSFFNVVCVTPPASQKRFLYELKVSIGEDSIKVKTSVEMMSKWTAGPPTKMSLIVPSNFISTNQLLRLDFVIRIKPARAT
ncbi:hypothetical protein ACS0TY_029772 [Phlomoides rotata]